MKFEHRAVPIALAAVLIDTIGFGIIMPVFPRLITTLGHIDLEHATRFAGYLLVIFSITQFIAGPILGNLSDRFGRRPVLIASMLSFGIDYALMAFAPTLGWLFLGRAVAGAAGAVYGPQASVLADVTPPEKRSGVFGLMGAAFGLGFVIGPAIGGLLAGLGPRAPFVAAALLALANALTMMLAMPETLAPENRRPFQLRDAHFIGAFKPLFEAGNAAPLLIAAFIWQLAHMIYPGNGLLGDRPVRLGPPGDRLVACFCRTGHGGRAGRTDRANNRQDRRAPRLGDRAGERRHGLPRLCVHHPVLAGVCLVPR